MVFEFVAGATLDAIAYRSQTSRPVTWDILRRELPTATYLSADERAEALIRLTSEGQGVLVGLLKKDAKSRNLAPEVEAKVLAEVESAVDPVAVLEARLAALEGPPVVGMQCQWCGIWVEPRGGKVLDDYWACSFCVRPNASVASAESVLEWAVSDVLHLGQRRVGSGALGVEPWYATGRTRPSARRWAHVDVSAVVAAFDRRFGERLSGPSVVLVGHQRMVTSKQFSEHGNVYASKTERLVFEPECVDPDTPASHARGPRPLTAAEAESAARRDTIDRKKLQARKLDHRRRGLLRQRAGLDARLAKVG